ncbi:MAG: RNA-binding protein [Candidatus Shapirobacteria bacterium]
MNPVKLYVGNLPYGATSDQLGQKFAAAGQVVSAQVVVDKFSGRSRGFGFVEMANQADAEKAVQMFHNQNFGEDDLARAIIVNVARPPKEKSWGGEGGDRGQGRW